MVKSKDDYNRRIDDSRFKKFDQLIDPSYGDKQYIILIIGIIVASPLLIGPLIIKTITLSPETEVIENQYEKGLNMTYIPKDKIFSVSFTNPSEDTLSMVTIVKIPFDMQTSTPTYMTVYESTTSKFPSTINYTPSEKVSDINHFIMVTLIKESGNYSYVYTAVPRAENRLWEGAGKYINGVTDIFTIKNETIN